MAKISYWDIPDEWVPLVEKILAWNDRFFFTSVRNKPAFKSRKRVAGITLRSLQPLAAEKWNELSQAEKDAWAQAASFSDLISFQLFLREIAARVKNELPLTPVPNDNVQYKCGRAVIAFPASGMLLKQEHPYRYNILRKVYGTRSQYETVELTEAFGLPLTFGLSWHTDLVSTGPEASAIFRVIIRSTYQGRDIYTPFEIPMGLTDEWQRNSVTITEVFGRPMGYTAYLDLKDVQGTFEWDNVILEHSGTNFARDPKCENVATDFTRSFQDIARSWEAEILPPGAGYDSIYYVL